MQWEYHLNYEYILCDIMPYSPLKVIRHFGGEYRLHFQGRRTGEARNHRKADSNCHLLFANFLRG